MIGMRLAIILLLVFGMLSAFSVVPDYRGIKDTGSESLPEMEIGITIDCDTKQLTINATEDEAPIQGATIYIFYTDYSYQALPTVVKTGSGGIATMDIPGNIRFLTALFILRVDHSAHRTREIEFTYEKCFLPPPPEPEPPEQNETVEPPPPVITPPEPNLTEPDITGPNATDMTDAASPAQNETGDAQEPEAAACPIGALLLGLLFFRP